MNKADFKAMIEAPQSIEDTIALMAMLLRTMGVDLGDEREVILILTDARFTSGDVLTLMDRAIERARVDDAAAPATLP